MLKKALLSTALLAFAAPAFADTVLKIGASPVPHAEILEQAKPLLAAEGITLEITVFQDYVLPNIALDGGDIDANYFQHIPYLNEVLAQNPDYKLVSAGGIHVEPIGIYSKRFGSLQELPDGGKVIMRDSVAEEGRILSIFAREGVVTLKEGVEPVSIRISDIVENPKGLEFFPNIEAALLPQMYANDEGDAVTINANYAIGAGLNPVTDPIALESAIDNPYANIITVREGDETRPEIVKLVEILKSDAIKDYIAATYQGAVIAVED